MAKGKLKFTHFSRAWYGHQCLLKVDYDDVVTIFDSAPSGGVFSEFQIKWYGGYPALEIYSEVWSQLDDYAIVIDLLKTVKKECITPDELCKMLVDIGLEDTTETEHQPM